MRVLIDECVDESLRHGIVGHDCQTCRPAGLRGLTNGRLLAAAERLGFEVLITVDRNMPHQQNLRDRSMALVILEASTTAMADLIVLLPDVLTALDVLKSGDVVRIGNR